MRVLFTCGGTGGHIFPALAVAEAFVKKYGRKIKILFAGSDYGMEKGIIKSRGFDYAAITARPFIRKFTLKNLENLFLNMKAVDRATKIINRFRPDLVYGTGGFVSFPVMLAASRMGIRTAVHEPNMVPGLANKWLSGKVDRITVGFDETKKYFPGQKVRVTGNPVRETLFDIKKTKAAKKMKLKAGQKTVLVMPGSRAAKKINEVLLKALPLLEKEFKALQLLWMCGAEDYSRLNKEIKNISGIKIKLFKFIENAGEAYAVSDAAILRAGASTLSEIAAVKMPSLLVPYPYAAAHHQEKNAAVFKKRKLAIVIKDRDLTPGKLVETLKELLEKNRNRAMRNRLGKIYKSNSAGKIVEVLAEK